METEQEQFLEPLKQTQIQHPTLLALQMLQLLT